MLAVATLRSSLAPLFDGPTMPSTAAVSRWLDAYIPYASNAIAGGTVPTLLKPPSGEGDFFTGLEAALLQLWTTAVWAGPGLTGITTFIPPLAPVLIAAGAQLIASTDASFGLHLLAESLHTYTLSIVVTITTASGVSSPAPLT